MAVTCPLWETRTASVPMGQPMIMWPVRLVDLDMRSLRASAMGPAAGGAVYHEFDVAEHALFLIHGGRL